MKSCMRASRDDPQPPRRLLSPATCTLVVYLHKNCNSDLFEAVHGELELSLSQIKLLHYLDGAATPITLKEKTELVRVSLPAASRLVDDLVRRGFMARDEDAEDRRMKRRRSPRSGVPSRAGSTPRG